MFLINQPKSIIKLVLISSSFAVLLIPATAKHSQAITLVDWDTIGWQDGVLNQEFQVGTNTINIDFTLGDEANFVSFGSAMTPSVSGTLNGSNPDSDQSLHLQLDANKVGAFADDSAPYSAIMDVDFSDSFSDISFNLYDIDIGFNWQDRVSVIGWGNNGEMAPEFTITNADYVEQVDSYTVDGITGSANDQNTSNILVSFNSPISGFQLIFTDGDDISSNIDPLSHGIGIGDISYTEVPNVKDVPEPASTIGLLALGVMGLSSRLKKVKQRS
jgi:hypothetical protein